MDNKELGMVLMRSEAVLSICAEGGVFTASVRVRRGTVPVHLFVGRGDSLDAAVVASLRLAYGAGALSFCCDKGRPSWL